MTFLSGWELRPLPPGREVDLRPQGLALGQGPHALEVVIADADRRPTMATTRSAWNRRLAGRAVLLLLVALYPEGASICGPGVRTPAYASGG